MSNRRAGRPDTVGGGEEEEEAAIDDREGISGSGAEVYEEEDEDGYLQEFINEVAGQETRSAGSGQIDQILDSISALASSVALLQVQADQERRLPQQGAKKGAALRRAPTHPRQAGTTRTQQRRDALLTTPTPFFSTAQALTSQPAPALTLVHCICKTMYGVAATTPNPRVHGFPVIFDLLEEGAHTTPC